MIRVIVFLALVATLPASPQQEKEYVAEFLEWLEHPSELGRKPSKIEIIDRRELVWPAGDHAGKKRMAILIRYEAEPEFKDRPLVGGIGIAGPMTWSHVGDHLQSPPEDVYGTYAAWHMYYDKLIRWIDLPSPAQVKEVLLRWKGPALSQVRLREAWEVRDTKDSKPNLVGLAEARCGSEDGFAVFDGSTSHFYPHSILPDGIWYGKVLPAHVGRRILGLQDSKERERWKKAWKARLPDVQDQMEFVKETIRRVQAGQEKLPDPSGMRFPEALEATGVWLKGQNRMNEFETMLDVLESQWKPQWLWNERLGRAAYKAGLHERAARLMGDFLKTYKYVGRGDEACLLARSLTKLGKAVEAREALVRSMRAAVNESNEKDARSHLGTQWQMEGWYQDFRSAYLELFGAVALKELEKAGLPASLISPGVDVAARQ